MKKILALALALIMMMGTVSALAEGVSYLGIGSVTSMASSTDATADAAGKFAANTTLASVVVDENGVILAALIDAIQAHANFDATGKITSDIAADVLTKAEKKEGYNMKPASPIGREWYEQIADLENWLVGKTVEDLKAAIEGNDETLLAVCTIKLGDVVAALEKAVASAMQAE